MRLGATIHRYCGVRITDPESHLAECRKHGFRAATCPDHKLGDSNQIRAIREAFAAEDVVIAEIGGWANCLDPRPAERQQAITTVAEALAVADDVGAVCCINIAGSFDRNSMYAPHPDNFGADAFDAVVQWVRRVLRETRPRRTRLVIEAMPWTPIHSPAAYHRLLTAVDDPGLAVHLDPVNFVTDASTYFRTGEMLDHCFRLFGTRIVACHAKDILQGDAKTVQLSEVPPGQGIFDYEQFLRRADQLSPDLPVVIEHLDTEQEYADAAAHLRAVARAVGTGGKR
jgi:sugar phosphate isomerase/epimerase